MAKAPLLAVPLALLGGCVVVEERPVAGPIVAVPMAIPLDSAVPTGAPHDSYYRSIFQQLQLAWLDRDAPRVRGLLDQHDRPDAPAWARTQFASFRGAAAALEFEALVADRGRVVLDDDGPAIGEPIAGRLVLGPLATPVRLAGAGDVNPTRFLVRLDLEDRDALGDSAARGNGAVVELPEPVDFAAGGIVSLPFSVATPAAGSVLRTLRIVVEILPGHMLFDGERVPNARVPIAASEHTLYPRGVEPIRARPLLTLRNALRSGEARHFANVYLAAHFLATGGEPAEQQQALALLVDKVRLGRPDQVRMAMAAAAHLAPDAPRVGDRGAWLRWWDARVDETTTARRPR